MPAERMSASLASSILDTELEADCTAIRKGGTTWKTGINVLDSTLPKNLWSGGHIIGVGSIIDDARAVKTSLSSSTTSSLPLEIVTTHLLTHTHSINPQQTALAPPSPSVFIICPPTQTTATIQRLHNNLSRPRPGHQLKSSPAHLLDNVSLLQYLDMSGLLESLAEVSATMASQAQTQRRCILLIQGLTVTLSAMQRRHGTVQAAAMMTSVAAALGALRRGMCLCLVELDIRKAAITEERAESDSGGSGSSGLRTAFTKTKKEDEMAKDVQLEVDIAQPVLRGLMEEALDVVVLVHDAGGRVEGKRRVVEVVKDERIGIGVTMEFDDGGGGSAAADEESRSVLGRWAVWQ